MTFTYREVAKFDNSANDFLGTDEMSVALKSFEATAGWWSPPKMHMLTKAIINELSRLH